MTTSVLAAAATGVVVGLLFGFLRRTAASASTRRAGGLGPWLARARIPLAPWQFVALVLGLGVGVFAVVFATTGLAVLAVPPAIGGSLLPVLYHDRRRRTLARDAVAAWPDGLRDVLAAVQSGMSLPTAIDRLAADGPAPLREAFEPYPALAAALGFETALEHVRARLADPISDRVIEAMRVGHARGGSALPEILSDLAESTTEDLWAAEQLRSEVLEQKINARAVFLLPWLVLVFLTSTPGDFRDFYSSGGGALVMALGALVSGIGIAIAERLGRDEVEERVLA